MKDLSNIFRTRAGAKEGNKMGNPEVMKQFIANVKVVGKLDQATKKLYPKSTEMK